MSCDRSLPESGLELASGERLEMPNAFALGREIDFVSIHVAPLYSQRESDSPRSPKSFWSRVQGAETHHIEKIAEVKPMAPITVDIVNEVRVRTAPEVSDATWTPLVLRAGRVLSGEVENSWLKYTDPRYVVYGRDDQKLEALYSILRDGDTELIRLSTKPEPAPDVTPEPRKRTAAASPAPHASMANPGWVTASCSSRHSTSATVIATARRARSSSAQSLMWRWARCAGHTARSTRLGISACS